MFVSRHALRSKTLTPLIHVHSPGSNWEEISGLEKLNRSPKESMELTAPLTFPWRSTDQSRDKSRRTTVSSCRKIALSSAGNSCTTKQMLHQNVNSSCVINASTSHLRKMDPKITQDTLSVDYTSLMELYGIQDGHTDLGGKVKLVQAFDRDNGWVNGVKGKPGMHCSISLLVSDDMKDELFRI